MITITFEYHQYTVQAEIKNDLLRAAYIMPATNGKRVQLKLTQELCAAVRVAYMGI